MTLINGRTMETMTMVSRKKPEDGRRNKKMKFQGLEWQELSEALGLSRKKYTTEELLPKTREVLLQAIKDGKQSKVTPIICSFLKSLAREAKIGQFDAPVWYGLIRIKDADTLIQYTVKLLDWMWSGM